MRPPERARATLADNGEVGRGRPRVRSDNYQTYSGEFGTAAPYLSARIARDHPDILARMRAGEYRSVRAAAITAATARRLTEYDILDM